MKKITKIEPVQRKNIDRLRVAVYARVSTSSEEQLLSLENQKRHYESRIKANPNWELIQVYFDEGVTGTKLDKRDGLKQLIGDCEAGKIDFIMSKSISRFARNAIDCLNLVRKLTDLNVHIEFEKENINTETMDSEMMLSILSGLAENESKSNSENIQWAIEKRYRDGTFKIGYPPYGYDWVNGEMVINEEQAKVVKSIYADVLVGISTESIAKDLNAKNVPTKKGKNWHSTTIRGIIKNEKYLGKVLFGKTFTDDNFNRKVNRGEKNQYLMESHHDAIIDEATFDKAQQMIRHHAKSKNIQADHDKYKNRYAFSGIIKCGECGGAFKRRIQTKSKDEKYVAWSCSNHLKDITTCSMKFIRDEQIKQAFVTMMNKLIFARKQVLEPLVSSVRSEVYQYDGLNQKEIDKRIDAINQQLFNLTKFLSNGYIEQATYFSEKNTLAHELQQLEREKLTEVNSQAGELNVIKSLEELIAFTSKTTEVEIYDESLFAKFVKEINIATRQEVVFVLYCGLKLKERMG